MRCASFATGVEPFFVLLGDYVVPSRSTLPAMKRVSDEHGGCSVVAVAPCAADEVSRYGVVAGECVSGGDSEAPSAMWRVSGMVEKPDPAEASSRLFMVVRYLLSPRVMGLLADRPAGAGGEVKLTDAVVRLLAEEERYALVVDPALGYDAGTPAGWIASNARLAAADPRMSAAFREAMGE